MRFVIEAAVAVLLAVVPVGAFYYFVHRSPPVTSPSLVGTPAPAPGALPPERLEAEFAKVAARLDKRDPASK